MSPVLACIRWAIDLAESPDDLAHWWRTHQGPLLSLSPPELAEAIVHKDARKAALSPPPLPRSPGPAAILPATHHPQPIAQRRLV